MKGASTEAAPAGNRGLTNVTNKESTMAASQHTRTSDGAGNIPPLVASINAYRDRRDPAQVDREIWAALHGASIEDLMRFRSDSARNPDGIQTESHRTFTVCATVRLPEGGQSA